MPSSLTWPPWGSSSRSVRRTAVVLPAPDGPTRAVVVPAGMWKLTSRRPTERASWRKSTASNATSAPLPLGGGRSRAWAESMMSGLTAASDTICSMSMKAWRISR